MKILFLTPFLPYPPQLGYTVRPFYRLKYISKRNEIFLISFINAVKENEYLSELGKYYSQVVTVLRRPKSRFKYRLKNLFESSPYYLKKQFESYEMQETLDLILEENNFDIVHVFSLAMAQYTLNMKGIPVILDAGDCITRNYLQQWQSKTGLRNRILSFIDWYKIKRYEPKMHAKFNRSFLVSFVDKRFMENSYPKLKLEAIPIGVDLEYFKPQVTKENFPTLIFVGDMSYTPNEEAMIYFCYKILPLVEKIYSQIKLYIVGRNVTNKVKKVVGNKKNIIITGFVEDVRIFISKATVFICPLKIGTGIKNKLLEAMAMGKPIVSSSIGVEGINVISGKNIMVADEPKEFADAVIKLLENRNIRNTMGINARKVVEKDHNWESLAMKIDEIYHELHGQ